MNSIDVPKEPKSTRRDFLKSIVKVGQLTLIRTSADKLSQVTNLFSKENPISKEKISPQEHVVILDVFNTRDNDGNIVEFSKPLTEEDRKLYYYPPEEFKSRQDEKEYYGFHLFNKVSWLLLDQIGRHGKYMYDTYMTVLKLFKGEQAKTKVPQQINITEKLKPYFHIDRNEQTGVINYTAFVNELPTDLMKNVKGKIVSFSFQLGELIGRLTPPEKVTEEKYRLTTASDIFSSMFQGNQELENDLTFLKIKDFVRSRYGNQIFYSSKDAKSEDQSLVFTSSVYANNSRFQELYRDLRDKDPSEQDKVLNSINGVILSTRYSENFYHTYTPMSSEDIEKFKVGKYYGSDPVSDQYQQEIIGAYSPKNPNRKKALDKMFAFARSLGRNKNMLIIPTGNYGDVILPEEKRDIPNNTIILGSCYYNGDPRNNTSGADVYIEMGSSSAATVSFSALLSYYCSETSTLPSTLDRKKVLRLIDALSRDVNGNKVILLEDLSEIKSRIRSIKI